MSQRELSTDETAVIDSSVNALNTVGEFLKHAEALPDIDKKAIEQCRNLTQTAITNAVKAVRAIPGNAE